MESAEAYDLIRHGFESGRPAHAYVVAGPPRGAGQDLVERVLCWLFCAAHGDEGGCGDCQACRQVKAHRYADILWVEPVKKSRIISIEQVRDLQQRIFRTAYDGAWKVCVLVGADRLGPAASNAFLKTLEEPAGQSLFFLLTDTPAFLLPTIISRCQRVTLSGSEDGPAADVAETIAGILGADAPACARSDGSSSSLLAFVRSERMGQVLKGLKKEAEAEVRSAAGEDDVDEERLNARASALYRERRMGLMRALLLWSRDQLLLAGGIADESVLHYPDRVEVLRRQTQGLDRRRALRNVDVVQNMYRQMEANVPDAQVLFFGFSRMG